MRILGIAGSLRRQSHNRKLLGAAEELLPPGVGFERFDGLKAIPPYDADDDVEPASAPVRELREAIAAADAVLFCTPEYNASIPGVLKNALDWASRPFPDNALRGKPVAVVGGSTGMFGAVWAQAELRKVAGALGAHVVDRELPVGLAEEAFTEAGRLAEQDLEAALGDVLAELLGGVREAAAA